MFDYAGFAHACGNHQCGHMHDTADGFQPEGRVHPDWDGPVRTPARMRLYENAVDAATPFGAPVRILAWGASIAMGGIEEIPVLLADEDGIIFDRVSERFRRGYSWYDQGYNNILFVADGRVMPRFTPGIGDYRVSRNWLSRATSSA